MKKHLLLLFCLVSSLMALAESEIVNIQTDVKLSASSQAEANIYTILLNNTNLYFSSKEVEDGRYTTYSLSSTPEEFFIEPVDYNPGCYKITGVNGKNVGTGAIYWDFADEDNALWEINNLEGLPTQIIRHGTTTGFGPDVAEEGKGVFTNKRDVLWQVKRINHTVTASGTCGANLTWKFKNGVLTISGTGAMYEFDAIMKNRPWELYSSYIGSVIIGNGVTSIGNYALSSCSGLTSVTIPNSVTSIGYRAFSGCSALTSVTIPNSVTSIGSETFEGCIGLTAVTIPNSVTTINHSAFSGCHIIYSKYINNSRCSDKDNWGLSLYDLETKEGLLIKDDVVGFCRHWASSVVIPNFVTSIGNHAFGGCSALTSITIPNSVTSIGDYAFGGCSALTSITIPNSVTSIGDYAFEHCRTLISITIPNSVTSIGEFTFHDCSGLTSVTIPNSVTSIGRSAFSACRCLTSVTIPNSVTSIESGVFGGCYALSTITIPNSVISINRDSFYDCSSLTTVNVSCSDINDFSRYLKRTDIKNVFHCEPFSGKTHNIYIAGALQTKINIPGSVTSIGEHAFDRCCNLESVTFSNSVTHIGDNAFWGCNNLASITIPNSVASIGVGAFSNCSGLTSVNLGNSVKSIGNNAFNGCTKVEELIYADGRATTIPTGLTSIASVIIPNSVETISAECFKGCSSLKMVVIGKSVRIIQDLAFAGADRIEQIYAFPVIPPTCASSNVFDSYVYKAAAVYVPNERDAVARYQSEYVWKNFFEIYSMEATGINAPAITPLPSERNYYNLQGQHTTDASRGISIVNGKKMLTH